MKRVSIRILPWTSISNEWQLVLLLGIATMLASPAHAQPVSQQAELFMRATCGGSLLTADEGDLDGLRDYVDLSSVHHDLSASVRIGSTTAPKLAIEPIRIVKSTSASSIGMIAAMARGQSCGEILIENWQTSQDSGVLEKVWELELVQAFIVARKEWQTADGSAPAPPQESFELSPSRVSWTQFINEPGPGGGVTPVEFTWDFETNTAP